MSLADLLSYDPTLGNFFVVGASGSRCPRRLVPDEEGYLVFFRKGQKYKLKANKVAIELHYGQPVAADRIVLHRNLDSKDYRLINLKVISREVMKLIKEAQRNLNGNLKIVPHPTDAFSYVLCWRQDGKDRTKVIHDIGTAQSELTRLQLAYAKVLNRFCVFDI